MHTTSLVAAFGLAASLSLASPATAPARAAGETCDGKAATLVVPTPAPGAYASAPLSGTPGDDVIVGTDWSDTIDGAGGNDTICALAGDDVVLGGAGDDRLFGGLDGAYSPDDDYFGDRIEPGPGDDHVDLGHDPQSQALYDVDRGFWDQVSFHHSAGPVTVDLVAGTATGEGHDTIAPIVHAAGIDGSAHADTLLGTDKDDWITAGGGDDTIDARGGADLVQADRSTGPRWNDTVHPGDDVVEGGEGRDEIIGGWGADQISAGAGNDVVWLHEGVDALVLGGDGRDYVSASGRVRIRGGAHADHLVPDAGSTSDLLRVRGDGGRDVLGLGLSLAVAPHGSRVVVGDPSGTVRVPGVGVVVRFATTEVFAPQSISYKTKLTWYGTRRADVLKVDGHDGPVRAFGRGGNDRLSGGWGRDLLDGGPGRDRIDGSNGRDRCLRGERLTSCEVRR